MDIRHLISDHSLLSRFVSEMRDVNIQKDALRFRRNIERVGEVMKSVKTYRMKCIRFKLH